MTDDMKRPPEPSFDFDDFLKGGGFNNKGGRPRKDGTSADNRPTIKDFGFSKREMARMRLFASVSDDVFEAALEKHREAMCSGKPVPAMETLLREHRNDAHEREMIADVRRIISSARRILQATEFDVDSTKLRNLAELTINAWSPLVD